MSIKNKTLICSRDRRYKVVFCADDLDIEGTQGPGPSKLGVVYGPNGLKGDYTTVVVDGYIRTPGRIDPASHYVEQAVPRRVMGWLLGEVWAEFCEFRAAAVEAEIKRMLAYLETLPVCSDGKIQVAFRDNQAGTPIQKIRDWLAWEADHYGIAVPELAITGRSA